VGEAAVPEASNTGNDVDATAGGAGDETAAGTPPASEPLGIKNLPATSITLALGAGLSAAQVGALSIRNPRHVEDIHGGSAALPRSRAASAADSVAASSVSGDGARRGSVGDADNADGRGVGRAATSDRVFGSAHGGAGSSAPVAGSNSVVSDMTASGWEHARAQRGHYPTYGEQPGACVHPASGRPLSRRRVATIVNLLHVMHAITRGKPDRVQQQLVKYK
jgi:hypothetical protein